MEWGENMIWLIIVAAFGTGFLLFLVAFLLLFRSKRAISSRLELFTRVQGPKNFDEEKLSKPFIERVVKPVIERLAAYLARLIPAKKSVDLQKKLLMAGTPGGFTAGEFVVIEYCLAAALTVGGIFLTLPSGSDLFTVVLVSAAGAGLGFYLPRVYLQLPASGRQSGI